MTDEIKRPFYVMGWIFAIMGALFLVTGLQAREIHDHEMLWTALPIGMAWTNIGIIFILLDIAFNE